MTDGDTTDGTTPERSIPGADTTRMATWRRSIERGSTQARGQTARSWPAGGGAKTALVVLTGLIIGALVGAGYGLVAGTTYRAAAYVAVTAEGDDQTHATSFAQAFGRIADESAIAAPAGQQLGVPAADLSEMVEVQTSPDAPLIEIAGVGPDAGRTPVAANAVADNLVAYANQRVADTRVRLSVFAPAVEPISPSSASASLLALVGAAGGMLVAALALFATSFRPADEHPADAAAASSNLPIPSVNGSVDRRNGSGPARSSSSQEVEQ